MRRSWLAVVVVCLGCASAPIKPADQAALLQADAGVLEGCYDCLLEARDTYQRIAVDRARPLVVGRLFEAEVLIALRERELALDSSAAEARALALAAELQPALDAERVLALVRLMLPAEDGTPRSVRAELTSQQRSSGALRGLTDEVAWLETSGLSEPVRQYLALSAYCVHTRTARLEYPSMPSMAELMNPASGTPPLLLYRVGACQSARALDNVVAAVPRFVEANYFRGRLAVGTIRQKGNVADTRAMLDLAYERLAVSPALTMLQGRFHQEIGDCVAGLRYYDETIALSPQHELALLGRTICLTYLDRSGEAIQAATHMIELDTYNVDEAYYWRAWNRRSRGELDLARADIELAKARRANERIYTLAGMIEHDQADYGPAETDLRTALRMPGGLFNCTAAWYLGLVLMERERWVETAETFERAMRCYGAAVAQSEAGLAQVIANDDLDPDFKQQQIAGFEAAIKEDKGQYHAAAFNAANHHARAGQIDKARPLLEIAAADPALADYVTKLREIIKRP